MQSLRSLFRHAILPASAVLLCLSACNDSRPGTPPGYWKVKSELTDALSPALQKLRENREKGDYVALMTDLKAIPTSFRDLKIEIVTVHGNQGEFTIVKGSNLSGSFSAFIFSRSMIERRRPIPYMSTSPLAAAEWDQLVTDVKEGSFGPTEQTQESQ